VRYSNQPVTTLFNPGTSVSLGARGQFTRGQLTRADFERSIDRVFDSYDRNRNGYIDRGEVPSLIKDTYQGIGVMMQPSQQDVESYLSSADASGNGGVSRSEFKMFVLQSLAQRGIIQ
jgi:Ca2+-binding EF-hand superfamily protein